MIRRAVVAALGLTGVLGLLLPVVRIAADENVFVSLNATGLISVLREMRLLSDPTSPAVPLVVLLGVVLAGACVVVVGAVCSGRLATLGSLAGSAGGLAALAHLRFLDDGLQEAVTAWALEEIPMAGQEMARAGVDALTLEPAAGLVMTVVALLLAAFVAWGSAPSPDRSAVARH